MLDKLDEALKFLPEAIKDPSKWDSLIINRRRPHTYRVFTILEGGLRVCLHRFEPCSPEEAFYHPHPWPGSFVVLKGSYRMRVGYSVDRTSKPIEVIDTVLTAGARYSMTNPMAWHSVQPLETCYSVMVNGEPWEEEIVHESAPTTKGKDLQKMTPDELRAHLDIYKVLLSNG